jgi:hypothetical protein
MKMERMSRTAMCAMTGRLLTIMIVMLLCGMPAGNAWAKDSMDVTVTNATGSPVIVNNGQAVGTIQLFYTVSASQFTLGEFATFDVNWIVSQGHPATDYGSGVTFALIQNQQGGNVDLSPDPATFTLTAAGQSGVSKVTVVITGTPPDDDGTDLVGNLKLDAGPKVGTVTNIQVHIRLVHPTTCLTVYDFVTDQDFSIGILSTTSLNVPTNGANAGKVVSSQPGQFSDNVLIANTCATDQSFDLRIGLDPSFSTNPNGNPGNAVFAYTAAGEFDTSNFGTILSGTGTGHQQNLCLPNVTVAANTSLLVTVHSKVRDKWPQASLPADGSFDFAASLYENVNAGCSGTLHSQATPNPATFTLPFTIH